MATYADQLARVRALIQARQPLPPDLGSWVESQLEAQAAKDYLRLRRDQYLRQAGEIAGGSSISYRVRAIQRAAAELNRAWAVYAARDPEPGTLKGAVHRARLILPIPGRRRLFEILQKGVQPSPL